MAENPTIPQELSPKENSEVLATIANATEPSQSPPPVAPVPMPTVPAALPTGNSEEAAKKLEEFLNKSSRLDPPDLFQSIWAKVTSTPVGPYRDANPNNVTNSYYIAGQSPVRYDPLPSGELAASYRAVPRELTRGGIEVLSQKYHAVPDIPFERRKLPILPPMTPSPIRSTEPPAQRIPRQIWDRATSTPIRPYFDVWEGNDTQNSVDLATGAFPHNYTIDPNTLNKPMDQAFHLDLTFSDPQPEPQRNQIQQSPQRIPAQIVRRPPSPYPKLMPVHEQVPQQFLQRAQSPVQTLQTSVGAVGGQFPMQTPIRMQSPAFNSPQRGQVPFQTSGGPYQSLGGQFEAADNFNFSQAENIPFVGMEPKGQDRANRYCPISPLPMLPKTDNPIILEALNRTMINRTCDMTRNTFQPGQVQTPVSVRRNETGFNNTYNLGNNVVPNNTYNLDNNAGLNNTYNLGNNVGLNNTYKLVNNTGLNDTYNLANNAGLNDTYNMGNNVGLNNTFNLPANSTQNRGAYPPSSAIPNNALNNTFNVPFDSSYNAGVSPGSGARNRAGTNVLQPLNRNDTYNLPIDSNPYNRGNPVSYVPRNGATPQALNKNILNETFDTMRQQPPISPKLSPPFSTRGPRGPQLASTPLNSPAFLEDSNWDTKLPSPIPPAQNTGSPSSANNYSSLPDVSALMKQIIERGERADPLGPSRIIHPPPTQHYIEGETYMNDFLDKLNSYCKEILLQFEDQMAVELPRIVQEQVNKTVDKMASREVLKGVLDVILPHTFTTALEEISDNKVYNTIKKTLGIKALNMVFPLMAKGQLACSKGCFCPKDQTVPTKTSIGTSPCGDNAKFECDPCAEFGFPGLRTRSRQRPMPPIRGESYLLGDICGGNNRNPKSRRGVGRDYSEDDSDDETDSCPCLQNR